MTRLKSERPVLPRMLERFPSQVASIRQLWLRSRSFRELCEDFDLALDTLERFEREFAQGRQLEIAEYRGLVTELDAEIVAILNRDSRPILT